MDSSNEDQAKTTWVERRRRMAIKKLGGVKVLLFLIAYAISSFKILRFGKALIQLPSKAKQNWTVIRN